jgi:type II secretory pathway pseudopilin PulG
MFNTKNWLSEPTSNFFTNSYIQGFLDICGNIVLRNGGFRLSNGDVSMNGNIFVNKNAIIIGDVSMSANFLVGLDASFNRNVSINGITSVSNTIYQIVGNRNINIASTPDTFVNYGTTATGPNLINIGKYNYTLTSNLLRDSITIGENSVNGSNPVGDTNISLGVDNFSNIINYGSQNIGIGTSTCNGVSSLGNNNTFIGYSVNKANNVYNSVCIGEGDSNIYKGDNTTSLNYTTNSSSLGNLKNNTTLIGYAANANNNNEMRLGDSNRTVEISGSLNVAKGIIDWTTLGNYNGFFMTPYKKIVGFSANTSNNTLEIFINANSRITFATLFNNIVFNTGEMANSTGIFTAPVTGYYIFYYHIYVTVTAGAATQTGSITLRKNATTSTNGTELSRQTWLSGVNISFNGSLPISVVALINANETVSAWTGSGSSTYRYSARGYDNGNGTSNCYGFLLYAA